MCSSKMQYVPVKRSAPGEREWWGGGGGRSNQRIADLKLDLLQVELAADRERRSRERCRTKDFFESLTSSLPD